jgi:hypothetical protein
LVFPPSHPTTLLCLDLMKTALASRAAAGSSIWAAARGFWPWRPWPWGPMGRWPWTSPAGRCARPQNAAKNGLLPRLKVIRGSTECLRGPFGLILANLPWGVQLERLDELCRLAGPDGVLILAGFKDVQAEPLRTGYENRGWSSWKSAAGTPGPRSRPRN